MMQNVLDNMVINYLNKNLMAEIRKLKSKGDVDKVLNLLDLRAIALNRKEKDPEVNVLRFMSGFSRMPYKLLKEIAALEDPFETNELMEVMHIIHEHLPPFDLFTRRTLGFET